MIMASCHKWFSLDDTQNTEHIARTQSHSQTHSTHIDTHHIHIRILPSDAFRLLTLSAPPSWVTDTPAGGCVSALQRQAGQIKNSQGKAVQGQVFVGWSARYPVRRSTQYLSIHPSFLLLRGTFGAVAQRWSSRSTRRTRARLIHFDPPNP
jgi:hypothetical protein